ncbi:MAG TPA: patatin-like phospholipase family protein [Spirochaetota bacterium]|nr:patatin-like phospholipase family protein [Spirochaetota bacterium]HPJ43783.1 patatin-like phospholipase family protein [Spirochaetota bacterium]
MERKNRRRIGLALSGGGVRAAAFHSGVLKYLAEKGKLEDVNHISSVSGGSLFTGLVFSINSGRWPSSKSYIEQVFPQIRKTFTTTSLQGGTAVKLLFNPVNWRFIFSRANVVASTIEEKWNIKMTLKELPKRPLWSINGTTGENGLRFRVKGKDFGDYELGYTEIPDYKLANAMAMSAAFPFGIGPLCLKIDKLKWRKKENWNSNRYIENYRPPFKKLHLYDGGVYDNLGLEPLFDTGRQVIKKQSAVDMVIVSDASSLLKEESIPNLLNPGRAVRVINMILSQVRSLRVRTFNNFLINNPGAGFYFMIGTSPVESIKAFRKSDVKIAKKLLQYDWLSEKGVKLAAGYKTTLKRMSEKEFDVISRHGYETAKWNFELFGKGFVNSSKGEQ